MIFPSVSPLVIPTDGVPHNGMMVTSDFEMIVLACNGMIPPE